MTGFYGKNQKILVLSVSAGAGHVRAAEALKASSLKWFDDADVIHVDVMELVSKLFRKVYADSYIKIVEKHPALWGYLYDKTDQEKADSALSKVRAAIERLSTHKLRKLLRDVEPDHVICTHFLPAQLLSRKRRKGLFSKPVWVVVTDFDVHGLWIHEYMDGYFAANEEVAWRMSGRGITRKIIHVTGIPIMPVFGEKRERGACAAEFGLDPLKKTFLMMSGGAGIGGIEALAEELLSLPYDFQMIGLAGRNEELLRRLQEISVIHPGRLFPVPYTKVIERLMTASDVAITKPGGLTTSECLAVGLPMIVVSPIPGQEERNADFLLENGAALKACDAGALSYRVSLLLQEQGRIAELREKASLLGKPEAGKAILETVLGKNIN